MRSPESGLVRKQESAPQLLAKVTFSRHEKTNYTGVGRDITEDGVAHAKEKGQVVTREKGAPALIGHSPRERAKGTAESIEEGIREEVGGPSSTRFIQVPGLRDTQFRDADFREELIEKLGSGMGAVESWADAHYHEPTFYDNKTKVETNEEKRVRLYREVERLISFLEKRDLKGEVPHLLFVSHYELMTLLIDDVFGIKSFETSHVPSYGEHVDVDIYRPLQTGDVPINVHYAGREKNVLFDRKLRRLIASSV